MSDLKPCPFCNGRPRLVAPVWDLLPYCECLRCGVKTSMSMTNAEAIAAWNRRASPTPEAIRREALEEAAKVAERGCLTHPDGGSPTEPERELCEAIAADIRALSPTSNPPQEMDA